MALILVCPAEHAAAVAREHAPSHVLALHGPGEPAPAAAAEHALALAAHDIDAPRAGLVAPDETLVAAMLAFGRSWTGARPLLVQCRMGISRSTAAAFVLACGRAPGREEEIATALRAASPVCTPNRLIVALADQALGRGGRMSAAVAAIGRGADYRPYRVFALALPAQAPSGIPT